MQCILQYTNHVLIICPDIIELIFALFKTIK